MYHKFKSDRSIIAWYIFYARTKRIKILSFFIFLQQFYLIFSTYIFSLGSASSHVATLLFKLEACTQLQLNKVAVTSKLCQWNRSRKSTESDILKNINFKRPQKEDLPQQNTKDIQASKYCIKNFESSIVTLFRKKILNLKKIAPNAAFFTSINLDSSAENIDISSQTDTADETDVTCLPEPLTSLFDSTAVNLGNGDLTSLCKDIYSQYHQEYRQKSYDNLTKVTILQSLNYN